MLITSGAIATIGGIAWKFWRLPIRFYEWYTAEEVEPAVNQLWREASFSGDNSDLKVIELDENHILVRSTTHKDGLGDDLEYSLTWKAWEEMVKARRLYCKDHNKSLEDQYFGEHSED